MSIPRLIKTKDGSHTLFHPTIGEYYHSSFGAIQESRHIFIEAGLSFAAAGLNQISILEIGYGTGLNALLSLKWALQYQKKIQYLGVEAHPLDVSVIKELNYGMLLDVPDGVLLQLHQAANKEMAINEYFSLRLQALSFEDVPLPDHYFDVVYFDAFSPEVQPGMWTEQGFEKIYRSMKTGGVLTTYSCKGSVKRALKNAGFQIEKLAGPPGKREFIRAHKL